MPWWSSQAQSVAREIEHGFTVGQARTPDPFSPFYSYTPVSSQVQSNYLWWSGVRLLQKP